MKKIILLLPIAMMMIVMNSSAQVTDKDGNIYKTVKIGSYEWMAENLNVSHFRNGDVVPEIKTKEEWIKAGKDHKPAWCYYNNDPANGKKWGKLYNWYAVIDPRGLAPDGWRIPSAIEEWPALINFLGGEKVAGDKMKSASGWTEGKGSNESGFSGLPGGERYETGTFYYGASDGSWWSSTEYYLGSVCVYSVNSNFIELYGTFPKPEGGHSVRCVRD